MNLRLNLGAYLQRHQITAYRLVSEVRGRVAPNTIYALARKPAQRIDLRTVGEVLSALERLTGGKVAIAEMLEEVQDAPQSVPDLSHLRLPPGTPAYAPSGKKFHYSGMGRPVKIEGGPSIVEIIAEGRGRKPG